MTRTLHAEDAGSVVVGGRHRASHRRVTRPAAGDSLARVAEALSRPGLESLQRTLAGLSDVVDELLAVQPRPSRRKHTDCGCADDCGCAKVTYDCHCACCIGDVDLAIYARVGERRVVPLTVENPRKRAKSVTLQLSDWSTRGGRTDVAVEAQLDRTKFEVAPCGVETVTLVVQASTRGDEEVERRGDVDDCTVYVADLRVEGCDVRPVRIALALLPRDCGAYEITCDCTCC